MKNHKETEDEVWEIWTGGHGLCEAENKNNKAAENVQLFEQATLPKLSVEYRRSSLENWEIEGIDRRKTWCKLVYCTQFQKWKCER